MKIAVEGQRISITEEEELVQNSENIYEAEFLFDASWDGFVKTAVFMAGYTRVPVLLQDGKCFIPPQCLKRAGTNLKISVTGINGDKLLPTTWCKTKAVVSGSGIGQNGSASGSSTIVSLAGAIGDTSALQTEGKNLVEAVNELKRVIDEGIGAESADNTATDDEIGEIIENTFGSDEDEQEPESGEGDEIEDPKNTASNGEVADILNDVFG